MFIWPGGLRLLLAVMLASSPLPFSPSSLSREIGAAPTTSAIGSRASPAPGWEWPLAPRPAVVRSFDAPARPWLPGHRGVDLAAVTSQELRSPAPGVVAFAGRVVDRPVVTVDHGNGLRSSFEPVETTLRAGDRVARGQALGRLSPDSTHCRAGPCVHWGVRDGDEYVNPLRYVADTRPSVLLPWSGVTMRGR